MSHDLGSLARICTRALWLEAGEVRAPGPTGELIRAYLTSSLASSRSGTALLQAGPVSVRDVRAGARGGPPDAALLRGDAVTVRVGFELAQPVPAFDFSLYVTNARGVRVLDEALTDTRSGRLPAGRYCAEMETPPVLNVGDYAVGLWCGTTRSTYLDEPAAARFTLHGNEQDRPDRAVVLGLPIEVHEVR